MLTRVNNTLVEMIDNVGDALRQYIEFKGDVDDFHAHQKEILEIRKKIKGE